MFFAFLDNVRSAYNVGSVFRTSDCAGIDGIIITGYTAHPPHPKVEKTSLGAELTIPWIYWEKPLTAIDALRLGTFDSSVKSANWNFKIDYFRQFKIIACEVTPQAEELFVYRLPHDVVTIFGNEVEGVQPALLAAADAQLKIPLFGSKNSLNIASSYAVIAYDYVRQTQ